MQEGGGLGFGHMAATFEKTAKLVDVAKAAGVSPGTVSNVFNRPEVVREEVRIRVRKAAERLGYRADPKGRLLRAGKVNAIGIATVEPLSHFFTDPYARGVMTSITEAAQAHRAGISLVSTANREDFAWNVGNALVDGFILFCLEGAPALIRSARERNLPFVALSLGEAYDGISAIGVDDVAAARTAAAHLAALGHRRFAVLTIRLGDTSGGRVTPADVAASVSSTARQRVEGYFDALGAAGVDIATIPIFSTHEDASTVHAALDEIFAVPSPPTAILAQSDVVALIALDWLRERGISVPGDVSVIGFDGVPESATSTPPLTTVAQPIAEIGRRAVQAILEFDGTTTRQVVDTWLAVRGTTAPPPAS
jgi:DNA-binding LacI/PurR family transcriptional regulator